MVTGCRGKHQARSDGGDRPGAGSPLRRPGPRTAPGSAGLLRSPPVRPGSLSRVPEGRRAGNLAGAEGSFLCKILARGQPVSAMGGSRLSPEVRAARLKSPHLLQLPRSSLLRGTAKVVNQLLAQGPPHRHLEDRGSGNRRRSHPVRTLEGRVLPFSPGAGVGIGWLTRPRLQQMERRISGFLMPAKRRSRRAPLPPLEGGELEPVPAAAP